MVQHIIINIFYMLLIFSLFASYSFNEKYYKINIIFLLKMSLIFKVIIGILGVIFSILYLNINILYIIIYLWIIYGILKSQNKKITLFKLFFIVQFWSLLNIIYYLLFCNVDFLNTLLFSFFINYICNENTDLYSNMDPKESKEILGKLHELLKEMDLSSFKFDFFKGKGPNPDPDFEKYLGLFLDIDEEPKEEWGVRGYSNHKSSYGAKSLYSETAKIISKKIDDYNSKLDYSRQNELLTEKNKIISLNNYIDYSYGSLNNFISRFPINNLNDLSGFFWYVKQDIHHEIAHYNSMFAAKYYYDNKDSSLLPNKFKELWDAWHLSQAFRFDHWYNKYFLGPMEAEDYSDTYKNNFFEQKNVYAELLDNILIVGTGLLCKIYIYENTLKFYNKEMKYPDYDIKIFQFYEKIWEFHKESLQKYYPFFDYYNWNCKLYFLEHATKNDILKYNVDGVTLPRLYEIPKLFEYMVELPYKPTTDNDIRPYCFNYLKCSPFTKGLHLIYPQFDVKNFFSKVVIEKSTPKKIEFGVGLVKCLLPTFSILQFKEFSCEFMSVWKKPIYLEKSIHYSEYYKNLNLNLSDKKEFLSKTSYKNALHVKNELYKDKINIKDFYKKNI